VREHARRLREEARQAREESRGAAGPGGRIGDPAGARFHSGQQDWGEQDWDMPGEGGWADWPGRRGWEDWARMRGKHGWTESLDFGTLRDLERVALQFTSDLRKLAVQSSAVGENVISDLRGILEDALDRIKSEIFGPGHEAPSAGGTQDSGKQD
jgi:hypothetical protein